MISTTLQDVLDAGDAYRAARGDYETTALAYGASLLALRKQTPHGRWGQLQRRFPESVRTIDRLINAAEVCIDSEGGGTIDAAVVSKRQEIVKAAIRACPNRWGDVGEHHPVLALPAVQVMNRHTRLITLAAWHRKACEQHEMVASGVLKPGEMPNENQNISASVTDLDCGEMPEQPEQSVRGEVGGWLPDGDDEDDAGAESVEAGAVGEGASDWDEGEGDEVEADDLGGVVGGGGVGGGGRAFDPESAPPPASLAPPRGSSADVSTEVSKQTSVAPKQTPVQQTFDAMWERAGIVIALTQELSIAVLDHDTAKVQGLLRRIKEAA